MAFVEKLKIIIKEVTSIYAGLFKQLLNICNFIVLYTQYIYSRQSIKVLKKVDLYKRSLTKKIAKTKKSFKVIQKNIKSKSIKQIARWNKNYKKILANKVFTLNVPKLSLNTEKLRKISKQKLRQITKVPYLLLNILATFHKSIKSIKKIRFPKRKEGKVKNVKEKPKKELRIGFVIVSSLYSITLLILLLSGALFYFQIFYTLPNVNNIEVGTKRLTSFVYDRNGELLYKNYKDENRTLVSINDLPDHLKEAIISVEDDDFYSHFGVSPKGIIRAAYKNYKNQDVVQGGSTITQQLVKNTLLTSEKTFDRKVKEAVLSIIVDYKYPKNEILEMYLNTVSFGGTSYGVQEASQMYFQKDAKDLTLGESAMLAGLPTAPTDNSPYADFNQSKKRQELVLGLMVKNGYITIQEAQEALAQDLNIKYPVTQIRYPHFVFYVNDYINDKYGEYLFDYGGLKVYTSLDPEIQDLTQKVVTDEVSKLGRLRISNGASLVTKNKTGEVVAMVGSKDFYAKDIDGFVNLTNSLRQPGSSIKPFNYSLAIKNGMTASTIIQDTPVTYTTPGSKPYQPVNYDGKFRGPVTIRRALANSLNIPAVKVLERNGVQNFIAYAKLFGFNNWNRDYYGLSLALGAAEVTMLELNQGFSVFANDGMVVENNPILYIENSEGEIIEYNACVYDESDFKGKTILFRPIPCGKQVTDSENAFVIKSILTDFNARREAFGVSILNVPGTGVKTGTTNDLRDNWAVGFNNEYTVGAWVGNNDNTPMSFVASGITGASPIWANVIKQITNEENSIVLTTPENVIAVNICPLTGQLACNSCGGVTEYFVNGTQPKQYCSDDEIKEIRDRQENKNKDNNEKKEDE